MSVAPHPAPETIIACESGALSGGWALAVTSHLATCSLCSETARTARAVGGAMLDGIAPVAPLQGSFEQIMERAEMAQRDPPSSFVADCPIPAPLQAFVGADINAMPWRRLGLTAHQVWIDTGDHTTRTRLLRVRPGESMPVHGHRGAEMTLVLVGSVHTEDGVLRPGDLEEADEATIHQPTAGMESECVCLAVTDAPLRFRSLIMRVAQPFLRI